MSVPTGGITGTAGFFGSTGAGGVGSTGADDIGAVGAGVMGRVLGSGTIGNTGSGVFVSGFGVGGADGIFGVVSGVTSVGSGVFAVGDATGGGDIAGIEGIPSGEGTVGNDGVEDVGDEGLGTGAGGAVPPVRIMSGEGRGGAVIAR